MLSDHELKIADFYHISIGNVKILVADSFDKEKHVLHYENLQLYLSLGLTLKKYIAYENLSNPSGKNYMLNSTNKKEQTQQKMKRKLEKHCRSYVI